MSDNHWSIYLIILGEEQAVRMNMTAEIRDPKGTMIWSSLNYVASTSTIQKWDFQVASGHSVKHIYQLMMGLGRDWYNMSGGGSGCRWWV